MRNKRKSRAVSEINVVPYIDVMLVLLVIFMITAPLLTQGINVKLPQSQTKQIEAKQEPIVVSVDKEGLYYLNVNKDPTVAISGQDLMTNVAAYLQVAKQKNEERSVYVKGDRDVNYGKVVEAMALLQMAGADHVGLITQSPAH
jgi:biopolymer transport protein TolR